MLPDDELLKVLQYLRPSQLLQCRAVCRRWRLMTLHRDLWRQKTFTCYSWPSQVLDLKAAQECGHRRDLALILRLAPCLRSLTLVNGYEDYEEEDDEEDDGEYAVSPGALRRRRDDDDAIGLDSLHECLTRVTLSSCAISELRIISFPAADSALVAVALARQLFLGRLKEVELEPAWKNEASLRRLRILLRQLVCSHGLESVKVVMYPDEDGRREDIVLGHPKPAQPEIPVKASLRKLSCSQFTDPYLPQYLEWHSSTLEDLTLLDDPKSLRVLSLLSSLPRLHSLHCVLLEGMPTMLPRPSLRSLHLVVEKGEVSRLPAAEQFLRGVAGHIEHLVLVYEDESSARAADLVLGLMGSSGTVALRSLKYRICSIYGPIYMGLVPKLPPQQLRPLAAVLPHLPLLTSLNIGGTPSDAFLNALDGRVVPQLSMLEVYTGPKCRHSWVHGEQVRQLMRRYPRLHVVLYPSLAYSGEAIPDDIECCPIDKKTACTLFSHPPGALCGVKHMEYAFDLRIYIN